MKIQIPDATCAMQCTIITGKFGSSVYVFASRSFSLFFFYSAFAFAFLFLRIFCSLQHRGMIVSANRMEQTQNYTWHAKRE